MSTCTSCVIRKIGKRRDGGTKYWCMEHKADATAKYGRRAQWCRYAHVPPVADNETIEIDVSRYARLAVWGAVPPIYDTTTEPIDRGIHVHARCSGALEKVMDETFREVRLVQGTNRESISELDAIYFMVSSLFGHSMKYIECSHCGWPHLDRDWFSVHPHQRHLCAACGRNFRDTEVSIGNPGLQSQAVFGASGRRTLSATKDLDIRQADFPGGIRIWGSNPAIVWTGRRRERAGIHLHAWRVGPKPELDETYRKVTIDGIRLDPRMVQVMMAQNALPHLERRVINLICEECDEPCFDDGEDAFTPRPARPCPACGAPVRSGGRLKNVIGNPLVGLVDQLAQYAPRNPQKHELELIPETL